MRMNKSLYTILGVALLAATKKQAGSLAKVDKVYKRFDEWLSETISALEDRYIDDSDMYSDVEDVWNEESGTWDTPDITRTLLESAKYALEKPDQKEEIYKKAPLCPEAYAYSGLMLSMMVHIGMSDMPYATRWNSNGDIEKAFSIDIGNDHYDSIAEQAYYYAKTVLSEIDAIKAYDNTNKTLKTESIAKEIVDFTESLVKVHITNHSKLPTMKLPFGMLSLGISGYLYMQTIKLVVSLCGDKELFNLARKGLFKAIEKTDVNIEDNNFIWDSKVFFGRNFLSNNVITPDLFGGGRYRSTNRMLPIRPPFFATLLSKAGTEAISKVKGYSILGERLKKALKRGMEANSSGTPTETMLQYRSHIIDDIFRETNKTVASSANEFMEELMAVEGITGFNWEQGLEMDEEAYSGIGGFLAYCDEKLREHGITDEYWEEQFYNSYDGWYPHLHKLYENENSLVSDLKVYLNSVSVFDSRIKESEPGGLVSGVNHTLDEFETNLQNDLDEKISTKRLLGNPLNMTLKTIDISPQDQLIAQLPIPQSVIEFYNEKRRTLPVALQQLPQEQVRIPDLKRIVIIEYRNPDTLKSITQNSPGELCLGRDNQEYKEKLKSGAQRHFGVLAQSGDGFHLLFHTHAERNQLTNKLFTDRNNKDGRSQKNTDNSEVLRQAERIIRQKLSNTFRRTKK